MKKQLLIISTLFMSFAAMAQWTPQATAYATPSRGVRNISAVDANTVWISAYDGSGGQATIQDFSKTTDGGATWTPGIVSAAPTTYNFSNLWAISATTAWACFYDGAANAGGGIFKTTDGGTNWTQQGAGSIFNATSFPDFVYFWDANNGFAVGDPNGPGVTYYEIYTTTDGGTTWTRTPSANIPAKLNNTEYAIVNDYTVHGNTIWFGTNAGRCYKSIDKGLNWTVSVVSANNTEVVSDIAFRSATEGLAIVSDANGSVFTTYKTTDGGATWAVLYPTSGVFYTTGDLETIPNSTAFVSTGAAPTVGLGSSYSVDGGDNWIAIDTLQMTALGWANGSTGWAGGFNTDATTGGIYKYAGATLGVSALNNDNARLRMFPNPSTGEFTFQIGGAETKDALVKIVDLVGNVAYEQTIDNSSSVIERKIDLSNAAKGVYMVTVENGTTRFINKIVIQ